MFHVAPPTVGGRRSCTPWDAALLSNKLSLQKTNGQQRSLHHHKINGPSVAAPAGHHHHRAASANHRLLISDLTLTEGRYDSFVPRAQDTNSLLGRWGPKRIAQAGTKVDTVLLSSSFLILSNLEDAFGLTPQPAHLLNTSRSLFCKSTFFQNLP